jgi:alpha-tubulin suppressor-like RCC1 family protein
MTAAADASGKAYTWGCGVSKRLGHDSSSNELVPRVVQALAGVLVTRVTCGHMHAAVVTSVGSVFTWGDGEFGKLGHGCSLRSTPARYLH